MDTNTGAKAPQLQTASAGGEQAAVQEQFLQMGTTQKESVDEIVDLKETGEPTAKKPPGNPMSNYFVSSCPSMASNLVLTAITSESLPTAPSSTFYSSLYAVLLPSALA